MSIGASLLRGVYRLSGVKKAFALPEEQLLKAIEKANRGRGFFMPTDRKAHYEKRVVNGFPCLIVRVESKPSQRAILFFFGGGMVIGPDKGDAAVLRKLCYGTGCDVWFPIYPLCTEHCITVSYDMAYACYRQVFLRRRAGTGHGRSQQRAGRSPVPAPAHCGRLPRRGTVERRGTRPHAGAESS